MNLRHEAEELAVALELGFAKVDEAVRWADAKIAELDRPPYGLIDVSMAGKSPALEIAYLLRKIPGEFDVRQVSRRVIARMAVTLKDNSATPESIARALYSMQLDGRVPEPDAASEMARLDDAFDLAHQGTYGTVDEARCDPLEFLERYGA